MQNTTATFPTEKIIEACKKCMQEIDADRKERTAKFLAPYLNRKMFFFFGRILTEKEVRDGFGISQSVGLALAENCSAKQYDIAGAILNLAHKTTDERMVVSADDFQYIKAFYKP